MHEVMHNLMHQKIYMHKCYAITVNRNDVLEANLLEIPIKTGIERDRLFAWVRTSFPIMGCLYSKLMPASWVIGVKVVLLYCIDRKY